MSKAIVLFSGGLDSTTCLALALTKHAEVVAVSFDYGQRHIVELERASKIAKKYGVEHIIVNIQNNIFQGSALTDKKIDVPNYQGLDTIPVTYVPARNTIFIAFALGIAESCAASAIYLGVSSVDYSGYPDCRPEYIESFQALINKAAPDHKIKLTTPLVNLSKAETIKLGLELGVDYSETISCYNADKDGNICGTCDSCTLRAKGFKELKSS